VIYESRGWTYVDWRLALELGDGVESLFEKKRVDPDDSD